MPELTRRSLRLAAEQSAAQATVDVVDERAAGSGIDDRADAATGSRGPKRPLLKSFRLWVPVAIGVILLAGVIATAVIGTRIAERAFAVRDSLSSAVPLATTAKNQLLSGDTESAQATAAELAQLTAEAKAQTDGRLWQFAESVPFVGSNFTAVRTTTEVVDDLVTEVVEPASQLSLQAFAPVDGRIDLGALDAASDLVDDVTVSLADARATLDGIDRAGLVDIVSSNVSRVDQMLAQIEPLVEPAQTALSILPGMLGADGPRNYLVLVQNNAESRGTGGNPAALVLIHVDNGAISIAQQASSQDFNNARPTPIVALDAGTVALYGDKVGRYMQDVTTTVDFTESARVMGAFWAESFGTPIDGTVSIDPVALSYLLTATGPVTMPGGDVLTSRTAVPMLLNEVYFRFEDPEAQDDYFALAAASVFDALTSAQDPRALVSQVVRAVDEGRILYVPVADAEADAIAGSRLTGTLPTDNSERTVVGAYINDITAGKLDYYLDTAVDVRADVCAASPTFEVTTTLTSTLQPDQVRGLARYISPARFFPKGVISTDVVLYGPVGASFASAAVDGVEVTPLVVVEHLGRPAVKINVRNDPATAHSVTAVFAGAADAAASGYGPIEAWHTPMVRPTPITIDSPACPAG